jgi:hypothetical protein
MKEAIFAVIGIITLIVLLTFAMAFPFMWIWNYAIVKAVTIANVVSYWPAYWMMLFVNIWIGTSVSKNN